jgi:hypothetical protein
MFFNKVRQFSHLFTEPARTRPVVGTAPPPPPRAPVLVPGVRRVAPPTVQATTEVVPRPKIGKGQFCFTSLACVDLNVTLLVYLSFVATRRFPRSFRRFTVAVSGVQDDSSL